MVFRSPELTHATTKKQIVSDPKYAAFTALDPFFDIVQQGLAGLVAMQRTAPRSADVVSC